MTPTPWIPAIWVEALDGAPVRLVQAGGLQFDYRGVFNPATGTTYERVTVYAKRGTEVRSTFTTKREAGSGEHRDPLPSQLVSAPAIVALVAALYETQQELEAAERAVDDLLADRERR